MDRIGIYGGAFNPPHLGHVRGAQFAIKMLKLRELYLIPSYTSPHKPCPVNTPSAEDRLEMTRLSVEGMEKISVSDMEIKREGISYTWQTAEAFRSRYPNSELVLLMGTDMFLHFRQWKKWESLLKICSLGVFYRGQKDEKEDIILEKHILEQEGTRIYLIENPVTEISSTMLRRLLIFRCGDSFITPAAAEYIRDNSLYGVDRDYTGLPMDELEKVVVSLMKPNRVAHVLGVRDTAEKLARLYGADPVDAARAGLLHDITKALDGPLQLTLCREYGTVLNKFSTQNPKTLHALTGGLVAQRIFGENREVVDAIFSHTTGKPNMTLLQKIIYVADYMEPNRNFPGVERLRELAWQDIDQALMLGLRMTLRLLKEQGREISPESSAALRYLEQSQKG